jgi:predicted MFS family arabinose efflux permease
MNAAAWKLTLAASVLMGLAMGGRSAFGLFVSPLNTASGMGLAAISFALALGQLGVGLAQPAIGAMADRYGPARVIVIGGMLLAATISALALWPISAVLALMLVASAVASSAVGSNGLLLGEVGRAVTPARAGLAVGIIGAGGSAGQLLLGPVMQWAIDYRGWAVALQAMAALSLVALPLSLVFRRKAGVAASHASAPAGSVREVLREWRFWRVAASFGVCGFHIGFLGVHMPGVIERCGLPSSLAGTWMALAGAANIAGSIVIGLALKRYPAGALLVGLYVTRALGIAGLLVFPVTPQVMLGFGLLMGASHMGTLPPTTQLIARQHGVQRLGTLFGVVMLVHQVGSFAGIWLGGWAAEVTGSDQLLWCIDAALALGAAALVWPRGGEAVKKPAMRPARA